MRVDGISINDQFAEELLRTFGLDPATLSDPEMRRKALGELILAGLERLADEAEATAKSEPAPPLDRAALEMALLKLAGTPRSLDPEADRRGVPARVWTPSGEWRDLADAPEGYERLEELSMALRELFDESPDLRVVASQRLLPTNESGLEIALARPLDRITVEARVAGRRYRFTIEGSDAVVIGRLAGDPELVPERDER
jgi:hypothetical protein